MESFYGKFNWQNYLCIELNKFNMRSTSLYTTKVFEKIDMLYIRSYVEHIQQPPLIKVLMLVIFYRKSQKLRKRSL